MFPPLEDLRLNRPVVVIGLGFPSIGSSFSNLPQVGIITAMELTLESVVCNSVTGFSCWNLTKLGQLHAGFWGVRGRAVGMEVCLPSGSILK